PPSTRSPAAARPKHKALASIESRDLWPRFLAKPAQDWLASRDCRHGRTLRPAALGLRRGAVGLEDTGEGIAARVPMPAHRGDAVLADTSEGPRGRRHKRRRYESLRGRRPRRVRPSMP